MGGSNILTWILILFVIGLIAFNVHLLLTVRKLENKYRRFMKGRDGISLEDQFIHEFDKLSGFTDGLAEVKSQVAQLRAIEQKNMTKYGVVKYDAFEDVGGRLSFVLALLNEEDSGIVLNAIHSKDNCFLYLKEVVKGESYIMLSSEEVQALRNAKSYDSAADVDNIMSTIEETAAKSGKAKKRTGRKHAKDAKGGAAQPKTAAEEEDALRYDLSGLPVISDPDDLPDVPQEEGRNGYAGDGMTETAEEPNVYADFSETLGSDFSSKMQELMHAQDRPEAKESADEDEGSPDGETDWLDE